MLSIEINQSNAAFGETGPECDAETARILHVLANHVIDGRTEGAVKDINGTTVGRMATAENRID